MLVYEDYFILFYVYLIQIKYYNSKIFLMLDLLNSIDNKNQNANKYMTSQVKLYCKGESYQFCGDLQYTQTGVLLLLCQNKSFYFDKLSKARFKIILFFRYYIKWSLLHCKLNSRCFQETYLYDYLSIRIYVRRVRFQMRSM